MAIWHEQPQDHCNGKDKRAEKADLGNIGRGHKDSVEKGNRRSLKQDVLRPIISFVAIERCQRTYIHAEIDNYIGNINWDKMLAAAFLPLQIYGRQGKQLIDVRCWLESEFPAIPSTI